MKFCAKCGDEIGTKDGDNLCRKCDDAAANGKRRPRARQMRKERHEVLTSLGLTRVRGALGGVYYE